jgi:hypothetical protein
MFHRKVFLILSALVLLGVSGCQPSFTVSTSPADRDFSALHPEVISGDGFAIQPDVRVFTLYAFLNGVAGWDNENGEGFTTQRQALRDALAERLAAVDPETVDRWRGYYKKHQRHPYAYLYYTLSLGVPPGFAHIVTAGEMKEPETASSLDGLDKVLSEFYQQAGLEELFERQFREMMAEEAANYDSEKIAAQVSAVYDYTRLDRAAAGDFDVVIVPNPFDSHYSAMSIGYQDRLYIVDGPGSNDDGLNIHEYLHMLMDDVIPADLAGQRARFNRMMKQNLDAPYVKGSYEEASTFVEEGLVRALDYRIRESIDPTYHLQARIAMADEVANGLVLVDDFYQALEQYEQDSSLSLEDFVTEMLKTIPDEQ